MSAAKMVPDIPGMEYDEARTRAFCEAFDAMREALEHLEAWCKKLQRIRAVADLPAGAQMIMSGDVEAAGRALLLAKKVKS